MVQRLLASDLDRTLLPNGLVEPEPHALEQFREWAGQRSQTWLTYVTGRHLDLALEVWRGYALPSPDWWVCNVGTEIYTGEDHELLTDWHDTLRAEFDAEQLRAWGQKTLRQAQLQEPEKQSDLKVSFYLYDNNNDPHRLRGPLEADLHQRGLKAQVVVSYDETKGIGLLDLLPLSAGKAQALAFLARRLGISQDATLFCGDSGNDLDILLSGVLGVLVGNATDQLRDYLRERLQVRPQAQVYFAHRPYTAGILEGMAHYGWTC